MAYSFFEVVTQMGDENRSRSNPCRFLFLIVTTQSELSELIRLLYAAAAGHGAWPDFLKRYAQSVHSPMAALMMQDVVSQKGIVAESVGQDPSWQRLYNEHYCAQNVWTINASHLFQPGLVAVGEQAGLSDRDFTATGFYHDYLRPQNFYHTFGGVITRDRSATSYITSLRPKSKGAYRGDEVGVLNALMPHLQCAMRIHYRLLAADGQVVAASAALHRLPWGVVVVDAESKIAWVNQAAEAILRRKDGLLPAKDGLRAATVRETTLLRNALRAALCGAEGGFRPGQVLSISRPSGLRSLTVLIAPLAANQERGFKRPAALVFLGDPELRPESNTEALRRLFDLTSAEAALAAALVEGKTIDEYTSEALISRNTARTHLKRIFSKTNTGRQSDLVRVLLRSVAGLLRTD